MNVYFFYELTALEKNLRLNTNLTVKTTMDYLLYNHKLTVQMLRH